MPSPAPAPKPVPTFPGGWQFVISLGLLAFAVSLRTVVGVNPGGATLSGPLLQAAAFAAMLITLARILSPGRWFGLAGGFITLLIFSPLAPRPGPVSSSASPFLILFALQLVCFIGETPGRRPWLAQAGHATLLALGFGLAFLRTGGAPRETSFLATLVDLLAGPFSNPFAALVLWAPAVFCLWRTRRAPMASRPGLVLSGWALWLLLQYLILAARGLPAGELLAASLLVNAACLVAFGRLSSRLGLSLVALWLILVGNALLHPAPARIAPTPAPALPRPLELVPAGPGAFRQNSFPPGPAGRDNLPALGTWDDGPAATGTWTSAPLSSSAPLLQFRLNGTLAPPATSLVLRTADGREIAPFDANFTAPDRWKRINFPVPAGPFQIVARDDSPTVWLAFTAPVEVSRFAWLAGKLARPWMVWAAVTAAGLAALAGWLRFRSALVTPAGPPGIAWPLVPWLALLAYAVFFSNHIDPVAGPNDSGGYLVSAQALVSGHLGPAPRPIWGPAAGETDITPYLATTFHPHASGRMAPEYPVGLPLLFAAAGRVLTLDRAVPVVILLQLVLGVFFTRQLARTLGLPAGWDWLAAGIIGLSPVYLYQGLQPQSDGPALVWCTAAVYWAWASRERPWLAVLAGLATALAVLIRPTNVLVAFPVVIALAGSWRQLGLWVAAGLPAAAWLAWYNHTLYGSALLTGYGDMSTGFGLRFVRPTLGSYAAWLPLLFTPVVVLGYAGPFLRGLSLRVRLMLGTWAGVFLVFYACYWCTWDNWYNMRFLLPAAPAFVVLSLFVTRALAERAGLALFQPGPWNRGFAPACLLVLALAVQLIADARQRNVLHWLHHNALNAYGPRWLAGHVPPNAVIFARHATNSLLYYTDLTFVRSDHPKAQSPEFFAEIAHTGRPVYALNYWWEGHGQEGGPGRGQGRPKLPGTWKEIATLWGDEFHVWQWTPPAPGSPSAGK